MVNYSIKGKESGHPIYLKALESKNNIIKDIKSASISTHHD